MPATVPDMATRAYDMSTRAASAAATREAILDATIALALELESVDFPLAQVARRAGRTVQTVLRHFGSRDALIEHAVQRGAAQVAEDRRATPGDIPRAIDLLVAHYERWGRFVVRLLAMGDDSPAVAVTGPGRLAHRAWVEDVFADRVAAAGQHGVALTDMLVVVTDVYAWKLLRLDRGLDPDTVRARITGMVRAVAEADPTEEVS
jgi:AcrR family transcriptional regulator